MSRENVETVRRGFVALNEGSVDGVLAEMDPGVEWYPTSDFVDIGPFRGHEGVRALVNLVFGVFDEYCLEPDELIDAGDAVIAPVHQTGRGRESGIEADVRYILVFKLRRGKAVRVESYYDRREALEAAGFEE
jgi:ketosteroid isomerase-like protein